MNSKVNLSDISKATLNGKAKKIVRNRYILAPLPEEIDDWDITEAKSCPEERIKRGVPHAIYYDTSNKIAIFPSDIPGFSDKYSTDWVSWTDDPWTTSVSQEDVDEIIRVFTELKEYFLSQDIPAYILYIHGSAKGNVGVVIDEPDYSDNISLWVYTDDDLIL